MQGGDTKLFGTTDGSKLHSSFVASTNIQKTHTFKKNVQVELEEKNQGKY